MVLGETFFELAQFHKQMEEIMTRHQAALILMDHERAHQLFEQYVDLLQLHIHHEDEVLMPVFRRIGQIKRWPAELFTGEHRKLEGFIERIETGLQDVGQIGPERVRAIIRLIDTEGGLKRLQEHHDLRERECFFPVLDQVTDGDERKALLGQIFAEWQQKMTELQVDVPLGS